MANSDLHSTPTHRGREQGFTLHVARLYAPNNCPNWPLTLKALPSCTFTVSLSTTSVTVVTGLLQDTIVSNFALSW